MLNKDWRKRLRHYSFQADAIPLAMAGAYTVMPADWQDVIPRDWLFYIAVGSWVLGTIGQFVRQDNKRGKK